MEDHDQEVDSSVIWLLEHGGLGGMWSRRMEFYPGYS